MIQYLLVVLAGCHRINLINVRYVGNYYVYEARIAYHLRVVQNVVRATLACAVFVLYLVRDWQQ